MTRKDGREEEQRKAEGKTTPAARDVDDDDVTERPDGSPDGSPDESRTEETRLGDFSTDPTSVDVATIPTMRLEGLDLPSQGALLQTEDSPFKALYCQP